MWDYDKLFAEGNIIGVLYGIDSPNKTMPYTYEEFQHMCSKDGRLFRNESLSAYNVKIQYIIRLDEHGNVVERIFDRKKDMKPEPEPMPELETGMFIRVYDKSEDETILAFVYKEGQRVIYQDGDFDYVADVIKGDYNKIVEVYPANVLSFRNCYRGAEIWRDPEY